MNKGKSNLHTQLLNRELFGHKPGAAVNAARSLYDFIVPNTAVTQVDLPEAHICKFSPDGQYLVCFGSAFQQLVVYRFIGHHRLYKRGTEGASEDQASFGAQRQQAAGPHANIASSSRGAAGVQAGNGLTSAHGLGYRRIPSLSNLLTAETAASKNQPSQFNDFFKLLHRTSLCTGRTSFVKDFALFPLPGGPLPLVLLASQSTLIDPARHQGAPLPPAEVNVVPYVERTVLHLVNLETGQQLDSIVWSHDWIPFSGNAAVSLHGDLLAVTAVRSQQVHLIQVLRSGCFVQVLELGKWCRDDDELVVRQAELAEQRWQQQQQAQKLQRRSQDVRRRSIDIYGGKRPREDPYSLLPDSRRPTWAPSHALDLPPVPPIPQAGSRGATPPLPQTTIHAMNHSASSPALRVSFPGGLWSGASSNTANHDASNPLSRHQAARTSIDGTPRPSMEQALPNAGQLVQATLHPANAAAVQPVGQAVGQPPRMATAQQTAIELNRINMDRMHISTDTARPHTPSLTVVFDARSQIAAPPATAQATPHNPVGLQQQQQEPTAQQGTTVPAGVTVGNTHPSPLINPTIQQAAEQGDEDMLTDNNKTQCAMLGGLKQRLLAHYMMSQLHAAAATVPHQNKSARAAAKRTAMRAFYNDFEALASLVIWRAQLVDKDLILLDLGSSSSPSDANSNSNGQLHNPSAPHGSAAGAQQSQYIALYNWRTAKVRAFLQSTSDAAIALLLRYSYLLGADATGYTWERYGHLGLHIQAAQHLLLGLLPDPHQYNTKLQGLGLTMLAQQASEGRASIDSSRSSMEGSARMSMEVTADRLATVRRALSLLPGGCQLVCTSPLLDSRLFLYDEKVLLPLARARPATEQPVRFYSVRRPEQVAFKLDQGNAINNIQLTLASNTKVALLIMVSTPDCMCGGGMLMTGRQQAVSKPYEIKDAKSPPMHGKQRSMSFRPLYASVKGKHKWAAAPLQKTIV